MKPVRVSYQLILVILLVVLNIGLPLSGVSAQSLSYENRIEVVLNDGTNVTLYRSLSGNKYYYLPSPDLIRLGTKQDDQKTPEFLFLMFTTEQKVEQGGTQGALLHFLLEWGLTPDQLKDLQLKVKEKTKNLGEVAGPVDLENPKDKPESFRIVSAVLQDKQLTNTLVTSGSAPPMPGGKVAVAAKLDKNGAQLLDATFKKTRSITDVSVVFDYEYTVLVKAAKGTLTYKLDITHNQGDGIAYDLIKKELDNKPELYKKAIRYYEDNKKKLKDECGVGDGMTNVLVGLQAIDITAGNTSGAGDTGSPWEYGISENMMRKLYDHFTSTEKIVLKWEEKIPDDRLQVIREAFFNFFLNAFTEPAFPELSTMSNLQNNVTMGDEAIKNSAQGGYRFKSCTRMNASRTLNKTIRLDNITLPVRRRYQMVTNLASTYDQVKNNPRCVGRINLNDPFFLHRDINFIIDVEAMEIFKDEINYVTANVRKKRSAGNPYSDAVTLSPEVMQDKGRLATLTYARGEDNNPDLYEYKVQWSLRGGKLYPENPTWQKGDWQAVTLKCPIKPRTIEFEADLEEMKEMGVTRATLQVRYMKYGQETETNIPITVSRNQPLVSQRIYTDREQTGYAYRMILNHKEKGKFALDWEAKINDDYIYATLPQKFKDNDKEFMDKIKKAAEVLLTNDNGESTTVDPKDRILDKFKDILKILID